MSARGASASARGASERARRLFARTSLAAIIALAALVAPARAERLVVSLSSARVLIASNYTGTEIALFGAVERDGAAVARAGPLDVAVVVRGPRGPVVVREKGRLGPVWINRAQRRYVEVPGFLAVLASRPLDQLADGPARRRLGLGLDEAFPQGLDPPPPAPAPFREALVRLRREAGLYAEAGDGVTFLGAAGGSNLFRARVALPATAPVGAYDVTVTLLSGGVALAREVVAFEVAKTGFEARTAEAARDRPLAYGLGTVSVALVLGWLASVAFRRD